MHLKDLKETPELHDGDRRSPEYRLCNPYTTPKGVSWITPRSDGHTLEQDLEIFYSGKTVFCGDKKLGVIISILDAPRTNIIKEYFQGPVVHEEAIDTCEAYRQNGITANFYYSVIKSKLSILPLNETINCIPGEDIYLFLCLKLFAKHEIRIT